MADKLKDETNDSWRATKSMLSIILNTFGPNGANIIKDFDDVKKIYNAWEGFTTDVNITGPDGKLYVIKDSDNAESVNGVKLNYDTLNAEDANNGEVNMNDLTDFDDSLLNAWWNSNDVQSIVAPVQTADIGYTDIGSTDTYGSVENNEAREAAFDAYYRDAMDYKTQGTFANDSYNRFVDSAQNEALEAGRLADISAQQQALQQAATIKGITDQLKQERMARLRAGMSESQIASQDMQNMMMNMQAVNQAANEANMARAQAQSSYGTAQDQAYQNWLQQANAQGTIGATYSAANAGDVIQQAKKLKRNPALTSYVNTVAGNNKSTT